MQRPHVRTRSSRINSVASGLGSLAGLVVFAVGVPLVLIVDGAGSPLSFVGHLFSDPTSVFRSLGQPVTDGIVAHTVVLLAWIVWVWLVMCVIAEVVARLRGRPATKLPASRYAQAIATLLVGASMALLPSAKSHVPMRITSGGTGQTMHQVVQLLHEREPASLVSFRGVECGPGSLSSNITSKPDVAAAANVRTYTVEPGDTLWSIARDELGSPLRWREIASLNHGKQQSDGKILADAGWILPGWVLDLPPDGSQMSVETEATTQLVGSRPIKRPKAPSTTQPKSTGQNPSGRSEDPANPAVAPTSGTEPKSHKVAQKSHSKEPVPTTYRVPLAERTSTTSPPTSTTSTNSTVPATVPETRGSVGSRGTHSTDAGRDTPAVAATTARDPHGDPIAPFGYGVLGAGVVVVINRLRRAQQRHRPSGLRIALPDRELAGAEQVLRSTADHEAAAWVDAALRTLVAACRRNQRRSPRVVAVRVLEHATELVLGSAIHSRPVVPPFEEHEDRSSWFLPRDDEILDEAQSDPWVAGMEVMSPGLVTLGRGSQGILLVDVEQAGSVAVVGKDSDSVLRAMAIELATASWAEQANVVLVGFDGVAHGDAPTLETLDRVRVAGNLVGLLPELRHVAGERAVMLDAVGLDRTSEARLSVSGDSWDLTVVFCSSNALVSNGKAVFELVDLAGDGARGVAVVCSGSSVGANWLVETGDGPVTFRLAGVPESMVWPQTVADDAGDQIAKLVDVARHLEGVDPTTPPYDELETRGAGVDIDDGPPPAIEIRVLGRVEVVGAARPFTRAWSLELVIYLAMHPGGATSDQWATHLWPNRSMAQASLHSTASAARRALGSTATGEDHLPRSHGRLALGPGVATDWDKFCRLAASDDPEAWGRALGLVRGLPFEGLRSTDWAVFSHVQANIESLVVDVSVRRSEHCLAIADTAGAEWSARKGLLVSAYDERLYRILMRAADLAGNPAGVEAVMAELLQLVGGEVEPYDSVHPETYDLYRALSRRSVPSRRV